MNENIQIIRDIKPLLADTFFESWDYFFSFFDDFEPWDLFQLQLNSDINWPTFIKKKLDI
jgi:hypothetical protein